MLNTSKTMKIKMNWENNWVI